MYILHPVGMPKYYFVSRYLGFSIQKDFALRYVSEEVAAMAAKVVQADLRRTHPKCRAMTYKLDDVD